MKVIQILPELSSGGVERGTLELAGRLTQSGHESIVISGGGRLVKKLEAAGSTHIEMPVGRKSLSALKLIAPLRRIFLEQKPDIIHLRSRVPAWLAWWAWRKIPAKQRPCLVTTVHGFYSVNRWSEIMCCGERVICVSESIKDYVLKHYPKTEAGKLRVVPRGVAAVEYPFGYRATADWRADFECQFPAIAGKRLVTLPGRITRLKGHEDLIRIMKSLPSELNIHALIVGGTHPRKTAYLEELKGKVEEAGLGAMITFTGNRDDLREILSISTLVLSLTRQPESFGRTTLEALAMGVPVAGYDHGGVAEQLETLFPDGRIPPLDTGAAAATVSRLIRSAPKVRQPNPFTLANMLGGTMGVYEELIATRALDKTRSG